MNFSLIVIILEKEIKLIEKNIHAKKEILYSNDELGLIYQEPLPEQNKNFSIYLLLLFR
jgi:hypothetical protein